MKKVLAALVYTAVALGANTAPAIAADVATLEALRTGDMKKLNVHSEPKPVSAKPFTREEGGEGQPAMGQGDVDRIEEAEAPQPGHRDGRRPENGSENRKLGHCAPCS